MLSLLLVREYSCFQQLLNKPVTYFKILKNITAKDTAADGYCHLYTLYHVAKMSAYGSV